MRHGANILNCWPTDFPLSESVSLWLYSGKTSRFWRKGKTKLWWDTILVLEKKMFLKIAPQLNPVRTGVWVDATILIIFSFCNSVIRWARVSPGVWANMRLRTGPAICQGLSGQASFHRTITGNNRYKLCLCLAKQTFILTNYFKAILSIPDRPAACKIFC